MARRAVGLGPIRQGLDVFHDRRDTGLGEVRAIGEIVVGRVLVGRSLGRVRIGDLVGRRRGRVAVAVAPEAGVAGAEHEVIGARAALERLVEIVAEGEAIGERLQG